MHFGIVFLRSFRAEKWFPLFLKTLYAPRFAFIAVLSRSTSSMSL